jgi:hypothetical protein
VDGPVILPSLRWPFAASGDTGMVSFVAYTDAGRFQLVRRLATARGIRVVVADKRGKSLRRGLVGGKDLDRRSVTQSAPESLSDGPKVHGHHSCHFGGRFSTKALTPSCPSSESMLAVMTALASTYACSSFCSS